MFIKARDPDRCIQPKMLELDPDPDPDEMNADPQPSLRSGDESADRSVSREDRDVAGLSDRSGGQHPGAGAGSVLP